MLACISCTPVWVLCGVCCRPDVIQHMGTGTVTSGSLVRYTFVSACARSLEPATLIFLPSHFMCLLQYLERHGGGSLT